MLLMVLVSVGCAEGKGIRKGGGVVGKAQEGRRGGGFIWAGFFSSRSQGWVRDCFVFVFLFFRLVPSILRALVTHAFFLSIFSAPPPPHFCLSLSQLSRFLCPPFLVYLFPFTPFPLLFSSFLCLSLPPFRTLPPLPHSLLT